ncbi:unnamed protein product [Boreogadus saida]
MIRINIEDIPFTEAVRRLLAKNLQEQKKREERAQKEEKEQQEEKERQENKGQQEKKGTGGEGPAGEGKKEQRRQLEKTMAVTPASLIWQAGASGKI